MEEKDEKAVGLCWPRREPGDAEYQRELSEPENHGKTAASIWRGKGGGKAAAGSSGEYRLK